MRGFRSFTWDGSRFPDPPKLLADLAKDGFKVVTIIDPGIKHDPNAGYTVYDDGVSGGHFVKRGDGSLYLGQVWPGEAVFPDFTRPATRAWWSGLVGELVKTGVRGVWIDMNEPTSWTPGGFPDDVRFDGEGQPTDHREAHNVYALQMARATREGQTAARPFVLTRAGFAGIQRFAAVWTGDMESSWEHLAMAPAMLLGLGLSGVPWVGTDVGGYSGGPGGELYARWLQLGSVSPFFRTHSQTGSPPQEPWAFGVELEAVNRRQLELRYRLLPYLYSLAREASTKGTPPLRPLLYEFAADPQTHAIGDELLLGPWLLAAPVLEAGKRTRQLYLPPGRWYDYWSRAVLEGGKQVTVAAPLACRSSSAGARSSRRGRRCTTRARRRSRR